MNEARERRRRGSKAAAAGRQSRSNVLVYGILDYIARLSKPGFFTNISLYSMAIIYHMLKSIATQIATIENGAKIDGNVCN